MNPGDIVTDPALLSQLPQQPPQQQDLTPGAIVTDPALLEQVQGQGQGGIGEDVKSALTGLGRGVLTAPGAIGDLANLIQLEYGKLTGDKATQDEAVHGLHGDNGFDLGTASLQKLLDEYGILTHKPEGDTASSLYNVGNFAGNTVGMGVGGLAKGVISDLGKVALSDSANAALAKLPATVAKDAVIGTGAGSGDETGRYIANNYVDPNSSHAQLLREALEIGGSLAGGLGSAGALNRTALYEKPDLVKDFEAAEVQPHFPSDVNPNPGTAGKFFSSFLPDRFGARSISQSNARATQGQLSDYARSFLNPGDTSLTQQGTALQQGAADSVAALKQETEAAYNKANGLIDPATPVPTDNTRQAISGLVDQVDDADLKNILQNPMFKKYESLLGKPFLTWSDMNILRQEIGANIGATQGSEQGLLRQAYKGVSQDLQTAAANNPDALKALNDANALYQVNQGKIDEILDTVQSKELPEALPNLMANQNGATRLTNLFDTPSFSNPATQGQIGQQLLGNRGMSGGNFDLNKLLQWWQSVSPETQQALTLDPDVAQGMQRLLRLYDATSGSRGIATQHSPGSLLSPGGIIHAIEPMVEGFGALHSAMTGSPEGALGIAAPIAAAGAATVGQSPGLVSRFGTPITGGMMTPKQTIGLTALPTMQNYFPDVWHPDASTQQSSENDTPMDAQTLGSMDRQSATAYIAGKLGQQVASQLANTDQQGYAAALYQLSSDPTTRSALFGSSPAQ